MIHSSVAEPRSSPRNALGGSAMGWKSIPAMSTLSSVEEAFKLLEGRWKMMIIFHLFDKDMLRFSELERAIPLASQKMLIQQLRYLERNGVVRRTVYPQVPPRVEYNLTELGLALRPALRELVQWATLRRKLTRDSLPGAQASKK